MCQDSVRSLREADKAQVKREAPDILDLCNQLPVEVVKLSKCQTDQGSIM